MSFYRCLKSSLMIGTALVAVQTLSACTTESANQLAYAPGLGEFMTQISTRHLKLWYAGDAENWSLAEYELEEIHEGLEDLAKYHPTHDKLAGSVPDLIAAYMNGPLNQIDAAIKNKNLENFRAGYDNLTTACNSCHQANHFGFNVLQRPDANPFSNQSFNKAHY